MQYIICFYKWNQTVKLSLYYFMCDGTPNINPGFFWCSCWPVFGFVCRVMCTVFRFVVLGCFLPRHYQFVFDFEHIFVIFHLYLVFIYLQFVLILIFWSVISESRSTFKKMTRSSLQWFVFSCICVLFYIHFLRVRLVSIDINFVLMPLTM